MPVEDLLDALRRDVSALDPSTLSGDHALRLVDLFTEVERVAVAGRALAAARVQQTRAWYATGASSATAWMATRAGSTMGQASAVLQTAQRLESLPATRGALVAGRLSEAQAIEISAAAEADPEAEAGLLELSQRESFVALRERCRDVRAAAAGDEDASERIRRSRYVRHWLDRDGALRLDARLVPEDAAGFLAMVRARADALERDARRAGQREPSEAYAADALCALAGDGASRAVVHVHVSQTALERGHTVAGETCRIEGVGPITVGAARRLAAAGRVNLIETNGIDVTRVAHAGRTIPAHLRTALEARDPTCVVPGCDRRRGLEIDHVVPFAQGGGTELANLARLCHWHHAQKTHYGWFLDGGPGRWEWTRTRGADPARENAGARGP